MYGSPLSPVAAVQSVLLAVRRQAEVNEYDARVAMLRAMVGLLEAEGVSALKVMTPETAEAVATELGAKHWEQWRYVVKLAMELGKAFGIETPDAIAQGSLLGWRVLAENAEKVLPHLPAAARRDFRAVAYFIADLTESETAKEQVSKLLAKAPEALFDLPPQEAAVREGLARYFGVLQTLTVAGQQSGVAPPGVAEALAAALWRNYLPREGSEFEEMAEDAYWSAEARESLLKGEEPRPLSQIEAQA